MRSLRTAAGALLAAGTLTALSPAQAMAGTADTPYPPTALTVRGPAATATVTCDPAGGTHPFAKEVCDELASAYGIVELVRPLPGMYCVQWIQPVQVSVTGYFRGRSVSYVRTEQNAGCARISRGHIFDF